jgi:hypothetical protein
MRNFLESRYLLLTWCLRAIRTLDAAGVLLLVALALWVTNAGAEQVAGPKVECPFGQHLVQAYIGPFLIGRICLSAAEQERWQPSATQDGKPLPVRVLIVKGKEK